MSTAVNRWEQYPVLPYVRLCYSFISKPFFQGKRRLLDYLILFIEKGKYVINVEGKDYELRQGEFALIQPGWLFTTHGLDDCVVPNAHLDIFYNEERESSFVTMPGQDDVSSYAHLLQPRLNDFPNIRVPVKFKPKQPIKCQDTLYGMIELFKRNDIKSTLKVQQLATDLVLLLLDDFSDLQPVSVEDHKLFQTMNAFMSLHLSSPLSVEQMAKYIGYSESHFSACFTRYFGQTPHQYLNHLRIQRAKELLTSTRWNLEKIAEYCGFSNASHISKSFKKATGASPRRFRAEQLHSQAQK